MAVSHLGSKDNFSACSLITEYNSYGDDYTNMVNRSGIDHTYKSSIIAGAYQNSAIVSGTRRSQRGGSLSIISGYGDRYS